MMEKNKQTLNPKKTGSMSKSTKLRISKVAKEIKGKELFPEKVALAKKTLSRLKSLPI